MPIMTATANGGLSARVSPASRGVRSVSAFFSSVLSALLTLAVNAAATAMLGLKQWCAVVPALSVRTRG